jgi:hypothetical protein
MNSLYKLFFFRWSYLLYSAVIKKIPSLEVVIGYLTYKLYVEKELLKAAFRKKIFGVRLLKFDNVSGLKVTGAVRLLRPKEALANTFRPTEMPIHKLPVLRIDNAMVFITEYNGIVLHNGKVLPLTHHKIAGERASEIFSSYPRLIYETVISNKPLEITDSRTIKYLLLHNWFNYYHFITETVYKLLAAEADTSDFVLLMPKNITEQKFVIEICDMLKVKTIAIDTNKHKILKLGTLYYIPEKPYCEEYNPYVLEKIRNILGEGIEAGKFDKVFISRKKKQRRAFVNCEEIEQVFRSFGFEVLYAEELTFREQIAIHKGCRFLAAMHGAGLTNMVFMEPGGTILEIHPELTTPEDHHSLVYWTMANALKHKYHVMWAKRPADNLSFFESNFYLNEAELNKTLTELNEE